MRDTSKAHKSELNGKSPIFNGNTKVGRETKKSSKKENKMYDEVSPDDIVSLSEVVKMNFETIKMKGRFAKLLGDLYNPFYILIYGLPYNGKSSVSLLFADDIMKEGLKALYVMNEEGVKAGLQEKATRLKVTSPIDVTENYDPAKFKPYDVVVLDSIQTCGMSPSDFAELKRRFPHTSFVLVSKANKDGTSKGTSDWEHDVDAVLRVEEGTAHIGKNRFPNGKIEALKLL